MKIAIIGGDGQLGSDLKSALCRHDISAPPHSSLDVTNDEAVLKYLETRKPDAVINTSAFHDVPKCELHPASAFLVNSVGPRNLARACKKIAARLVHISTDYVFDGALGRPYTEVDLPAPLMVYGASKLAGEHLALSENPNTIIARVTGLFGRNPCRAKPGGRNFVELMLHVGREKGEVTVVTDQKCCPTYTKDLALQITTLLEADAKPGVYHAVTPTGCSWYEYAKLIFETAGMDVVVSAVTSDHFPASFRRPMDSRLTCDKLEKAGLMCMRPLGEAITEYLALRGEIGT
jgi:dTDP-4-dehydrorhamnose reductase